MNEQRVANTIKHYLNLSANQLDSETLAGLQKARAEVLARHGERKPALGLVWAGHGGSGSGHGGHHAGARMWVAAVLLLAVVLGITYWHDSEQNTTDPGDIDAALLADELPVRAYLDHRFDAWLNRSEQ